MVEFEYRPTYSGSWRTNSFKDLFACQNEVDPQWTVIECLSLKPSQYLQAYTTNLLNIEGCLMQKNRLLIKKSVDLEDNSIVGCTCWLSIIADLKIYIKTGSILSTDVLANMHQEKSHSIHTFHKFSILIMTLGPFSLSIIEIRKSFKVSYSRLQKWSLLKSPFT